MNLFTAEQTEDDAKLWLVAGLLGLLIEKPAGLAMNSYEDTNLGQFTARSPLIHKKVDRELLAY